MAKKLSILLVLLALAWAESHAVEELMPMHPGAPFNEVGIGASAAPIRRATSEDEAAQRPARSQPLRKNLVTLKIPPPQSQGEGRLRMVEARVDARDGTLEFDLAGAPLADRNMEIPGMVEPESLAMNKCNLANGEAPGWPVEPPARPGSRLREPDPLPGPAETIARPRMEWERDEMLAKALAPLVIDMPDAAERPASKTPAPPQTASRSLRPPAAAGEGEAVSRLKPPATGQPPAPKPVLSVGLTDAMPEGSASGLAMIPLDVLESGQLSLTAVGPMQALPERSPPRRKPAPPSLPEPDADGMVPMRQAWSILLPGN